jgi:hypothetical protein
MEQQIKVIDAEDLRDEVSKLFNERFSVVGVLKIDFGMVEIGKSDEGYPQYRAPNGTDVEAFVRDGLAYSVHEPTEGDTPFDLIEIMCHEQGMEPIKALQLACQRLGMLDVAAQIDDYVKADDTTIH